MQSPCSPSREPERGYILLTLMLFVALLTVAAIAIVPSITFQIRRDREEELIHRGTQYSRAIRNYFKRFGRYPTSLTALDNTNNERFLRKHYKDPITGKDFRLLHYSELQMMNMGAGIPGAAPAAGTGGMTQTTMGNGFSLGATSTQSPGTQSQGTATTGTGAESGSTTAGEGQNDQSSLGGSQPAIVGGPIVGVISTSKAATIREFGGKDHYNQWQFIYNPVSDNTKGLIDTPWQPPLQGVAPNLNATGQAGNAVSSGVTGPATTPSVNSGGTASPQSNQPTTTQEPEQPSNASPNP